MPLFLLRSRKWLRKKSKKWGRLPKTKGINKSATWKASPSIPQPSFIQNSLAIRYKKRLRVVYKNNTVNYPLSDLLCFCSQARRKTQSLQYSVLQSINISRYFSNLNFRDFESVCCLFQFPIQVHLFNPIFHSKVSMCGKFYNIQLQNYFFECILSK